MLSISPQAGIAPAAPDPTGLIRWPTVRDLTGLSRSTVDRLERAGSFPKRVQLSALAVGWRKAEVLAWTQSREVRR